MSNRIIQSIKALDLEEKVLNGSACLAIVGTFLPWFSGEWLGAEASSTFSGFGFFTSFLGLCVFLLLITTVCIVLVPALGGPVIVKKRHRDAVRLILSSQAAVLTLAALSVLTRITFEFSRMEIRFGIYLTLIGSLIAALYSFLRLQEYRRLHERGFFRHPEDTAPPPEQEAVVAPPPPPPPPPAPEADEHRLYP